MGLTSRRTSRFASALALGAVVTLAAAPTVAADSTTQADGTITVSSLGSSAVAGGSATGSLGSVASPAYAKYVAVGDSYGAFGDQEQPSGSPAPCAQSLTNYPHQLAANPAVGELTDVTCGGAVVGDLFDVRHPGVAPQLDALTEDTDLVTLSIGGNDVGFGGIVACIMSGPQGFPDTPPKDCEEEMGEEVAAAISAVYGESGALNDVYAAIAEKAPNAKVIATQYLPLMPATNADACLMTQLIGDANVEWAREITAEINEAVAAAAERNGHVSVLPVDTTQDRSACAEPGEQWTVFLEEGPTHAAPFHPTQLGQAAVAAAVAGEL